MDIGWILRQGLEFGGTALGTIGLDRMLRGEVEEGLKRGWGQFKARVEQQAKYRVVVWDYVANGVADPYRTALQKRHADAVAAGQLLYANRIESVYVLVYLTFEDETLGIEQERKQARGRAFEEFGRKALEDDPQAFDTLLEFYEQREFRTYLLVAKHFGIDVWEFLGTHLTTLVEAIGGEGAVEKMKVYLQNPEKWKGDWTVHRARVRGWAEQKTQAMRDANAASRVAAAERPPDRGVYYVAGGVLLVILLSLIFGWFI